MPDARNRTQNTSCNAVTATGAGTNFRVQNANKARKIRLDVPSPSGGTCSALQVDLEGGNDGVNFPIKMGTVNSPTGGSITAKRPPTVLYVRANLITRTVSGGSPAVSATVSIL